MGTSHIITNIKFKLAKSHIYIFVAYDGEHSRIFPRQNSECHLM